MSIQRLPGNQSITPPQQQSGVTQTGSLGGVQVQQVQTQPHVLRESGSVGGHVDTVTLHTALQQVNDLGLGQVQVEPRGGQGTQDTGRPSVLQQQVQDKLMTFDDLAGKIGHRPHTDRLRGLWKMSAEYKAVERAMDEVHQELSHTSFADVRDDPAARQAMVDKLNTLARSADAYIASHTGTFHTSQAQQAKIDAMRPVAEQARAALAMLNQAISDPGAGTMPDDLTLQQALDIKRCGIGFADCDFTHFNDGLLDAGRSNANFGAGAANTVAKLVYGTGPDAPVKIFKPEPETDRNPLMAAGKLGIARETPHYGNRNIAAQAMDEALGGNVIIKARFAVHGGQVGLLMDKAEGMSPSERVKVPVGDDSPEKRFIDGVLAGAPSPEEGVKRLKSMEFVKVGDQWCKLGTAFVNPFGNTRPTPQLVANLQRQLCHLEWSDAAMGQFDRHGLNYLTNFDRTTHSVDVRGIDNDLAFGSTPLAETLPPPGPDPGTGYNGIGKPALIDRTTYDRMHNTDFDRDILPKLQGRLSQAEIDTSRTRFEMLQDHAETLASEGKVVDNWETWQSGSGQSVTQFLNSQTTNNSYFKRDWADHVAHFG